MTLPNRRTCLHYLSLSLLTVTLATSEAIAQDSAAGEQPTWGRISPATNESGTVTLEVKSWPKDGKLPLPGTIPSISAAHLMVMGHRIPLKWSDGTGPGKAYVDVPAQAPARLPATVILETAGKSPQWSGGRIFLKAENATIEGTQAKLVSQANSSYIGNWTGTNDLVKWDYKPSRWGMYEVELTYATEGLQSADLNVQVGDRTLTLIRPGTGGADQFTTVSAGRFYLAKAEPFTISVSCARLKGTMVMNLKGLTLRPAPEGKPIIQNDASLTLHASNSITHSVTMRYEPLPEKNCLGFWVSPKDWAEWEFRVTRPGAYQVEVSLGCGKGQGGSDIVVEAAGETLPFAVVDTGDYHVHTNQVVGVIKFSTPGSYSLAVKPVHKKSGPIMDIEKVILTPKAN